MSRGRALRRALRLTAALAVLGGLLALGPASRAVPGPARAAAATLGRAPRTLALELPLRVDSAGLQRFATAVSTLGSPEYGRYASVPWLAHRFGASPATRARVLRWLRHTGATGVRIDPTGLFADATMGVAQAQRRFGTALERFRSGPSADALAPSGGREHARIPAALRGAVTGVVGLDTRRFIAGTATRARPRTPPSSGYPTRTGTASGCAGALAGPGFTPNQYLSAYGYSPLQQAQLGGQGERVALIEIDGFQPSDVQTFASCFGLPMPNIHSYGVGIRNALAPGAEATLDLELLDASAPSLKEIDVYESAPIASDVLRSLTEPLSARGRKPDVISASLGTCEADVQAAVGTAGIETIEQTLELAAATGVSVVAASGDHGSTGCLGTHARPLDTLAVDFPASSPWVTGVGGTNLTLNSANAITSQVAWNDEPTLPDAGGGGASMFARPTYQDGFDRSSQREVPDVSMLSDPLPGYEIYCTAKTTCVTPTQPSPWISFGGTSAATPLLAGGLALVDQDLRLHGQKDVGFLNPLLYGTARTATAGTTLSDVTSGSNDLSQALFGRELGCCTARPGYDEASGLGSVNLSGLDALARARVARQVSVGVSLPAQRTPLAAEHLLATVSCTSECLMGAFAQISLGRGAHPLHAYSSAYVLTARHSRTIRIPLSGSLRTAIHAALADHQPVVATVYGALIDVSGEIERQSAARTLRITG